LCSRKGNGSILSELFELLPSVFQGEFLNVLAEVAELVDALDSKSSNGNIVWVRVPPSVLEACACAQAFLFYPHR
jgi:hypothetical protein